MPPFKSLAALLLPLSAGVAAAQDAPPDPHRSDDPAGLPPTPTVPLQGAQSAGAALPFDTLDVDADGNIGKGEAGADVRLAQQFGKFDRDGSGRIDAREYEAFRAAVSGR